jgi:NHL repeat
VKTQVRLLALVASAGAALALPLGAFGHTVSPNFAGTGDADFGGDGGPAPEAHLDGPHSIAPAPGGDGYLIVDTYNNRIRKVARDGKISTVVGEGSGSWNGDGLSALSTKLNEPRGVASTSDGSLLIADTENHRIRKVAPGFGTVSTVVGNGNEGGLLSSLLGALLGTDAELDHPSAVAVKPDGSFLIADTENNVIRHVVGDTMTTVAGNGTGGYAGEGVDATDAQLCEPEDVAVTADGGFLIADTGNHVIRHVDADGVITTVAGNGSQGYSGEDVAPTSAELSRPKGVEVLDGGGFLIADTGNDAIRRVKNDKIKTKAGGSTVQATSDDEDADELNSPTDVLEVAEDVMLVADAGGNRVHMVGSRTAEEPKDDDEAPILPPVVDGGKPADNGKRGEGRKPGLLPPPDAPTVAEDLNVARTEGMVRIKLPGSDQYVLLERDASIPFGSVVDAKRGTVTLTSARNGRGVTQSAAFRGSFFKVTQRRSRRPVTDLRLRGGDFDSCGRGAPRAGAATIARKRRKRARRRLWGRGHGRFRTIGRHGAATVRGTIWLTADRCGGTLVRVRRGRVQVRDFRARKTVFVGAGQSYFARISKRHVRRR